MAPQNATPYSTAGQSSMAVSQRTENGTTDAAVVSAVPIEQVPAFPVAPDFGPAPAYPQEPVWRCWGCSEGAPESRVTIHGKHRIPICYGCYADDRVVKTLVDEYNAWKSQWWLRQRANADKAFPQGGF